MSHLTLNYFFRRKISLLTSLRERVSQGTNTPVCLKYLDKTNFGMVSAEKRVSKMCVFVHNEIKRLESNHIYCIKCVFNPPEEHWLHLTTINYESYKMTLCRGRTQFPFVMFCPYHQLSSQDNKKASQTLDKTSIMMFYHKFTHPHQFFLPLWSFLLWNRGRYSLLNQFQ